MADDLDTTPLTFGKHRGKTPEEIADEDPSYVVWLYENVKPRRCSRSLAVACEAETRELDEDARHRIDDDR